MFPVTAQGVDRYRDLLLDGNPKLQLHPRPPCGRQHRSRGVYKYTRKKRRLQTLQPKHPEGRTGAQTESCVSLRALSPTSKQIQQNLSELRQTKAAGSDNLTVAGENQHRSSPKRIKQESVQCDKDQQSQTQ